MQIEYSVTPNLIYIRGENFGENEGTVTLGGVPYPLIVQTWHGITIIAELPQIIPGDYVLTITTAEKPSYKANIEITIETVELQGTQEDPRRKSR